jgi:hypothetical protein
MTFAHADVDLRYDRSAVSPILHALEVQAAGTDEDRLIEPTSPILGPLWVASLKADRRTPPEIIAAIKAENPTWERDLRISMVAYFDTLQPGLDAYCAATEHTTAPPDGGEWTEVEQAAIPLQVLKPLHADYLTHLQEIEALVRGGTLDDAALVERSNAAAAKFQTARNTCSVVRKLQGLEGTGAVFLGGSLMDLNDRVSSPEAPYPRLQFAINGFTQYVYQQLIAYPKLEQLLSDTLAAETEWVRNEDQGQAQPLFTAFMRDRLLARGYSGRSILLALSYSTRNMASIDTQYGIDLNRALLLEAYFWQFRNIRTALNGHHLSRIYANHVFSQDPGVYHYMTAGLLSCEVYDGGHSLGSALLMGYLSKLAYKAHKLLAYINKFEDEQTHNPFKVWKYAKQVAKEQGFSTGLEAGKYGGQGGLEMCLRSDKIVRDRMRESIDAELASLPVGHAGDARRGELERQRARLPLLRNLNRD